MATVYLARDLKHERQVAIKVLRPELAAVLGPDRFLREIKLTAQLNHPHILPLLDSGEAGGFLYYVMPYAEGESLRDRLNREKQLPVEAALQIAREVAAGGATALRGGIFKPRTNPYAVRGHGYEALELLCAAGRETGLPVVTEVMAVEQV